MEDLKDSGVLRLYVVECVYFRIKLNTLGHGLRLNRETKQQAPWEWGEVPESAGILLPTGLGWVHWHRRACPLQEPSGTAGQGHGGGKAGCAQF